MSQHLHHKLETLHQSLLHGKLPRSVHWSDIVDLMRHLGQVQDHGADELAFIVGTRREVFKRPRTPEVGVEEVSRLRQFLKEAGAEAPSKALDEPHRIIAVIDHHAAHIYRDLGESRPQDGASITPYDPHHFHHHLIHRKEAHYQGERVPEESSFYEEVAAALAPANEIVLIGHGTGKSSAVSALQEHLRSHHNELSRKVKTTEIVDLSALTEAQIESIAKRHLTTRI